jgi:hypothetical protein
MGGGPGYLGGGLGAGGIHKAGLRAGPGLAGRPAARCNLAGTPPGQQASNRNQACSALVSPWPELAAVPAPLVLVVLAGRAVPEPVAGRAGAAVTPP